MKNVIVKKGLWGLGLLLMLGVSVAAYGVSRSGEETDSSGKVESVSAGTDACEKQCAREAGKKACCSDKANAAESGDSCCKDSSDSCEDSGEKCCEDSGEKCCEDKCELGADGTAAKGEEAGSTCCSKK